jgi:hypothetical protein
MSVSHRISIRFLPDPPAEPTSTLVLTTPGRTFIDLRYHVKTATLYWGFSGVSPRVGEWVHAIDSRSDSPAVDCAAGMVPLGDGDVLEVGSMLDFENPEMGERAYEEVWRDEVLAEAEGVAGVLRLEGERGDGHGLVVRVAGWAQGIVKRDGRTTTERWREGERVWRVGEEVGMPCGRVWDGEMEVGSVVEEAGMRWRVVEWVRW